jgi:hypothetical protein
VPKENFFWLKRRFAFKDSKRVGYNEVSLAAYANAFVQKDCCCIEVDWRGKKGRQLQGQYLASNSRSLSSKRTVPATEPKKLPP